jgi:hypothetical protein
MMLPTDLAFIQDRAFSKHVYAYAKDSSLFFKVCGGIWDFSFIFEARGIIDDCVFFLLVGFFCCVLQVD